MNPEIVSFQYATAYLLSYVMLVLLEDIILNRLSLSVILMCGSIALLTGLSISGIACRVINVNANSISVFKQNL